MVQEGSGIAAAISQGFLSVPQLSGNNLGAPVSNSMTALQFNPVLEDF